VRLIDLSIPWGPEVEPVPNNPRIFYVPIKAVRVAAEKLRS
jgi:hypothetical protein